MGTTPMGVGSTSQSSGNGGHHKDDDNDPSTSSALDPDPEDFNEFHCLNNPYFCGEGAPTIPVLPTQEDSSCPMCVVRGGAIIIATGILELAFGIAAIAAVALSGPAAIPGVALVILPTEIVLGNITLIGIEYVKQGSTRDAASIEIDYLPILHIFTNPNEGKYFP